MRTTWNGTRLEMNASSVDPTNGDTHHSEQKLRNCAGGVSTQRSIALTGSSPAGWEVSARAAASTDFANVCPNFVISSRSRATLGKSGTSAAGSWSPSVPGTNTRAPAVALE